MISPCFLPVTFTRRWSFSLLLCRSFVASSLPLLSNLRYCPSLARMPKPLLAQASAHDRACASGFALTLVEHWVSTMDTLFQLSAAANAGNTRTKLNRMTNLFMFFTLLWVSNLEKFPVQARCRADWV